MRVQSRGGPAEWAEGVAERIIGRFTRERPGWQAGCESMKHLKLVVVAELAREVREARNVKTVVG